MPVPIEYTSIRRMSTITVPNQDISFDSYDFQLCAPQADVKDAFESRELEATFCKDFSCCGLVLSDLHELLQHYEECHVRLEDDESNLYDDESSFWSPQLSSAASSVTGGSEPSSPISSDEESSFSSDVLKKRAAAYLSDLYNSNTTLSPLSLSHPPSPTESSQSTSSVSSASSQEEVPEEEPTKKQQKKRSYGQFSSNTPSALDLLTQSAAKKLALASGNNGDLPTPILTDEDFLAQAGALLASANTNANADKPYKCNVPGCQKAYKNPNGLKYHNQHGHCDLISDESENIASKPYQCTIGDCGKRYKNLNGLKYHIEHSHMAALNHTLANFGSSLFSSVQFEQPTTAPSSPEASPQPSPVLSAASLAALF
ncbi:hypothetical protein BCR43DRAFT_491791 [Syncephalastrum racemosum]|uniref:C2H2-type domain-containing protein n=1 Tax=Syncephalastrum racemosum TaxID=13706 RepID=A0A1X2HCJ5_SYNRA|nr:hypothetical protein BCR43DRAFT_491791 [Syncephalastrum racemosum]